MRRKSAQNNGTEGKVMAHMFSGLKTGDHPLRLIFYFRIDNLYVLLDNPRIRRDIRSDSGKYGVKKFKMSLKYFCVMIRDRHPFRSTFIA
jgi:hypothetical protein